MARISEDRVDLLEEKVRAKIDTMTGFSDVEAKSRALEKIFKYFDVEETGRIDYNQFFAAMTRLNFVGVQRELESLFDRYDEDCSNTIWYKTFSDHIFGMGEHIAMNSTSRSVVERIKAQIFDRGGVSGLRHLRAHLQRMDKTGSGLLGRAELCEGLANFGLDGDDGPGGDVDKLMGFFDHDGGGRISIQEFHRGLRGNMPKRRQLVVKETFQRLAASGGGAVTLEDIRRCYDPISHPDVASGRLSPAEAFDDLAGALAYQDDGDGPSEVYFIDFMDYFRDLSAAIENDDYFRGVALNSWVSHTCPTNGTMPDNGPNMRGTVAAGDIKSRRALVTHPDGVQEILEIENGADIGPDDHELMRQRLEEQGVQEIASVSLHE